MNTKKCGCDEKVQAVRRKLERLAGVGFATLDEIVAKNQVDVTTEVEAINKKLLKGMTKDELWAGITDGDVLSFKNLTDRSDVKNAIKQTEEVHLKAFEHAIKIGGEIHNAEIKLNDLIEDIMDDAIIFGVNENIQGRLKTFNSKVKMILSSVQ